MELFAVNIYDQINNTYMHTHTYMSHRKNPGNTKYVLDGHWFMEIDGK